MRKQKYGRRRGLGSVFSLFDDEARATYLRALALYGHERACAMAEVGLNSADRLAARDAEFRAARDKALNAYRFQRVEAILDRCLAIVADPESDTEALELAFRWLAANSPGVLVDPNLLKKGDNGASSTTRPVPGHVIVRKPGIPSPAVRGGSALRLSVGAVDDSIDNELKRLGIDTGEPPPNGHNGTNGHASH